jgi:hypothetical protein
MGSPLHAMLRQEKSQKFGLRYQRNNTFLYTANKSFVKLNNIFIL